MNLFMKPHQIQAAFNSLLSLFVQSTDNAQSLF